MELQQLEMERVFPSGSNTRMDYNGSDMAELVKSIKAVGLLSPIIVRETADTLPEGKQLGWEIIAGHRRFHAMKKLAAETIPAFIVQTGEEGAKQIRMIENLHRKNLNPIEEAFAFDQMRIQHDMDVTAISNLADKSVAYITRALALLSLPKNAIEAIRDGLMPASHGHQIARAPMKERERLAEFATKVGDWTKRVPTLDELKREIEKKIEKSLKLAPFPKDAAFYGGDKMASCGLCPYNTGNQNVLFDGAVEGSCTNPGCYKGREKTFYTLMEEQGAKKWPDMKFLGAKVPGYNSEREFAGFPIVLQSDKKNQKFIAEHPENFAFGIWKPEPHGYGKKKPEFVVVCIKVSDKAAVRQGQPDYERERFIQERVNICLIEWASKETPLIEKKHLIQMLEADDADEQQKLYKKSLPELMKTYWLQWLGSWELAAKLEQVGIETKSVIKAANKEAAKMYDENKASKEKIA